MAMMNGMDYGMADMALGGGFRVAIYCRLSKDDDLQGESASIANQRDMLEKYCERQGWEVAAVYQDDGYTGLNMERPDLKRMLKAVERRLFLFGSCAASAEIASPLAPPPPTSLVCRQDLELQTIPSQNLRLPAKSVKTYVCPNTSLPPCHLQEKS